MAYRIGWLSPLTPTSGVGTFSDAVSRQLPREVDGESIDLTMFYVGHATLYRSAHRAIEIGRVEGFGEILTLFDLLIYNMGNNIAHHEPIFALLRAYPGLVICHDHVYQQFFAGLSLTSGKSFASFAALMLSYGGPAAPEDLRRSRITDQIGPVRYKPWDGDAAARQPMNEPIFALGSALVVHSSFARRHAERSFSGPVLQLGMPHDQKAGMRAKDHSAWPRQLADRRCFELVSFGHIQAAKCLDLVLAAMAASPILRRRIRYTIAGFVCDETYLDRLKTLVTAHGLNDHVTFATELSDERLHKLIARADIFANLRRPNTEGASVSLIEQLDAGKPVIVFDSGCYTDVPANAAIKLAPDAGVSALRAALERLVDDPAAMATTGRAGRAYARGWTCRSYAEALLRFAFENRALLKRRADMTAVRTRTPPRACAGPAGETGPSADPAVDAAWTRDLARARLKLAYVDRKSLAVDPALILGRSGEALSTYVAHVLFGIFENADLENALSRFFETLDRWAAYWACVRFAVLADAVFAEDEDACGRLIGMSPCHDIAFWSVIAALPGRRCIAAATLMLARRPPTQEEVAVTGLDDVDGFPKHLRIADLVRALKPAPASTLAHLGAWLEASGAPALGQLSTAIDTDLDCAVGGPDFMARVELSGFYAMEADHAWTRGAVGFLGLRLDRPAHVDVLVRHIRASAAQPASILLSHADAEARVKTRDCVPLWLSVPVVPAGTAWLRIATDITAVPANSVDTRPLGLCCLRIRVRLQRAFSKTEP